MSREALERVIQQASSEPHFYARLDLAAQANHVLDEYDLTAEEREALLKKDGAAFQRLGVAQNVAALADWCTGE